MIKGIIFDFNRTLYNPEKAELNYGATDLLDYLKNKEYKMCLISKNTLGDGRKQISDLGLEKYFLDIQVLVEERTQQNFESCAKVMGLDNSEIAVVGDRTKSEIALGNKLGMITIWYKVGKFASELPRNSEEEPNYSITSLENVIECLE